MDWALWLGAALLLSIIEVLSADLFFLMLALAAGASGIAALTGISTTGQVIVFAVTSFILLLLVRPWAKRILQRSTPHVETNVNALIGQNGVVTETVDANNGRIRLVGEIWSAASAHNEVFSVGTSVTVIRIDGAYAIVGPQTKSPQP